MTKAIEQHLRVSEVAKQLGVSRQTVCRWFEKRPGIKIIGNRQGSRSKRRYRTLLIPESLVRQYLAEAESA